jgi:hypothetical protein
LAIRPASTETPVAREKSNSAASASSLNRPYPEMGTGVLCSSNGGCADPPYTPPAEEA